MRIVVVGAGIIGSAIAYHLARAGAQVQIIEARRPGIGTSSATFAYLNVLRHSDDEHGAFRLRALRYWDELAATIDGTRFLTRGGSLFFGDTPTDAARLDKLETEATGVGLVCERWPARRVVAELEPDLVLPESDAPALRMPQEGRLEPVPMIGRLIAAARACGAALAPDETVDAIEEGDGGVRVTTTHRVVAADHAVLAAGPATGPLLERIGVDLPIRTQPGVIAVTRPLPIQLRHVVYAGKVHFAPEGAGRIIVGRTDYRTTMPSAEDIAAYRSETAALLRPWLRGLDADEFECTRVGVRPIPADGQPMIGPVPGWSRLSIAVMHSGISLAALAGQLLAEELVRGRMVDALAPYRPARFLAGAKLRDSFAPWAPGDAIAAT